MDSSNIGDSTVNKKILEINPITNNHQTNSFDIQEALNQVGEGEKYNAAHFRAGTYLIDNSIEYKKEPFSIIAFNPESEIYGDWGTDSPATLFQLMKDAPLEPFGCGVPIFGPSKALVENVQFYNIAFDGNCPIGGGCQKYVKDAKCNGSKVGPGVETGKGFHNLFGTRDRAIKYFELHHFKATNTAGDIFRSNRSKQSSGIKIYQGYVGFCGHCAFMFENSTDFLVEDCTVITRANGAFRSQKNCSKGTFKNIHVVGTPYNYNPGAQITGDNIKVTGCLIHDTMGPGIEIIGEDNKEIEISDCQFLNCGTFAIKNNSNYNVAGILANGANVLIKNNLFYGCYQNAISANIYRPDGTLYKKSGFIITTDDNRIIDTKPSNYQVAENGKHIANLLKPTHTITSKGNKLFPENN
ncbi:MAG: hypothetical protein QG646_3686 [Euryarchaeota archaeon]|nr:hypothetical protein [Euryarchaeota archaeon]